MPSDENQSDETLSFVDALWQQLSAAVSYRAEKRLARFVNQRGVKKWFIATDYCIKEKNRPIDSFAFVIMPAGEQLEDTIKRVNNIPKRDLKNTKKIPDPLKRLLRKGKVFTFAFAVDPKRRIYTSADTARKNVDETIAMMERWKDADNQKPVIDAVRRMRQKMNKKVFDLRLLENIVIIAAIVSFIGSLLCKYGQAEMIGWAPDRDKITDTYEGIAYTLFCANLSALCQNGGFRQPSPGIFTQSNKDLWLDPYIRTADFVAGAVAAWDPPLTAHVPPKIAEIIRYIFADNRYLFIFRIAYYSENNFLKFEIRGISMSSRGSRPHQQGRRQLFEGVEALQGRSKRL